MRLLAFEMASDVDFFVQDADDFDLPIIGTEIKNQMMATSKTAIARHDKIDRLAKAVVVAEHNKRVEKAANINLGLLCRPILDSVAPDIVKIRFGSRA